MSNYTDFQLIAAAKKVPGDIRKIILNREFIDLAVNVMEPNTPMEFLFDVYEEFIDANGEHDDWTCYQCRAYILQQWKSIKPHLQNLEAHGN